ncbi:MAG: hypothetical protein KZQ99_02555 [Candidatus Thiodiazotropha sp. (ex Dulcina madagascariensis)]|nr:hypothetical protein [Candidatus Thiodiazotropha sp. (ex Dulcina madagascariensis)]
MQPTFSIVVGGQDITGVIAGRLISMAVTDEAGQQSDTVSITLDNRDRRISMPEKGAVLLVSLGYRDTGVLFNGRYTVDEVSVYGTPLTMTIAGKAADMRAGMKERKTRAFTNTTLGDLVATVAADHGMTAKVGDDLASVAVARVDQTNESDIHLLTRLAADYGAVSKPANGFLLFVKRGQAKSASGQLIPPVAITADQVSNYRFTFADRGKYKSVIAHWHNTATGEREPVSAGDGRPAYTLRGSYPDQPAASAAAAAKLASLQRGEGTGSITLPGDPRLAAEGIVTLSGFMDGVDGDWLASRVAHSLTGTYSTSLSLEMRK